MYNVTRVLHYADSVTEQQREEIRGHLAEAAANTGPSRQLIGPTLPGVINGGDLIIHLQYPEAATWEKHRDTLAAAIDAVPTVRVDGADYSPGAGGPREGYTGGAGVYRTLLLRAEPDAPSADLAEFDADTLTMPRYVTSMLAWRLSPIDRSYGPTEWTHVWEQEYRDLDGLLGQYMLHPVHWAVVDRWFDPEFPRYVVRTKICHTYCDSDGEPIITGGQP